MSACVAHWRSGGPEGQRSSTAVLPPCPNDGGDSSWIANHRQMAGIGDEGQVNARIDRLQKGLELVRGEQFVLGADDDSGRCRNVRQDRTPVAPELQARHQAEGVDRRAALVGLGRGGEGDRRQSLKPRETDCVEQREGGDSRQGNACPTASVA